VTEIIKSLCINEKVFPGIDFNDFPVEDVSEIEGMSY